MNEEGQAELSRAGVTGDPELMGRWPTGHPEAKNRAVSHTRKGKYIQPETVRLERGRAK